MSGIDEMPKSVKKKMKESRIMNNLLKIVRRSCINYWFVDVSTRYGTSRGRVSYTSVTRINWDDIRAGDCIIVDEDWGEVSLRVRQG